MRFRFLARIELDGGLKAVDPWRPKDAPVPFTGDEEPGAYRPVRVVGGAAEPDGPRFAAAGSGLAKLVPLAVREGVDPEFPAALDAEVEAMCAPRDVPYGTDDPSLDDRREVPFVTIDNEDSRDLDQALHLERDGSDTRVRYALADAAYYVRPGTALFAEALSRQASYYLPGWMIPMLPRPLCEDLVSLNPGVPRRALVFDMRVSADGRVRSTRCGARSSGATPSSATPACRPSSTRRAATRGSASPSRRAWSCCGRSAARAWRKLASGTSCGTAGARSRSA